MLINYLKYIYSGLMRSVWNYGLHKLICFFVMQHLKILNASLNVLFLLCKHALTVITFWAFLPFRIYQLSLSQYIFQSSIFMFRHLENIFLSTEVFICSLLCQLRLASYMNSFTRLRYGSKYIYVPISW
jgi:hypothetical protein